MKTNLWDRLGHETTLFAHYASSSAWNRLLTYLVLVYFTSLLGV